MKKLICVHLFTLALLNSFAQPGISKGASLLFKNNKSRLSQAEKSTIFQQSGLTLSKDQKQFAVKDEENVEYPFGASAYNLDMNGDGKEEVFVVFGNSYTSGMTGSSVILFIKDAGGKYQTHLGFPSTTPSMLPFKNKGYPDLVLGGPGFVFPVWRWNGKTYDFFRKIKEKELLKHKTIYVDAASELYQKKI
jgi:hypothetical protein